jgi:hypothetical protein
MQQYIDTTLNDNLLLRAPVNDIVNAGLKMMGTPVRN